MKNTYLFGAVLMLLGFVTSQFAPPVERIDIGKVHAEPMTIPTRTFAPEKKLLPVKKQEVRPAAEPLDLDGNRLAYIKKWAPTAQALQKKYGIPASIKLAQGILESSSGSSDLCRMSNNHFGIKCFGKNCSKWHCVNKEDDTKHDRFRVYKNGMESFVSHSKFLTDPAKEYRYGFLFKLNPKDYKAWAYGLKKAGYATNKMYAQKIIKIIEDYRLYEYD